MKKNCMILITNISYDNDDRRIKNRVAIFVKFQISYLLITNEI